MTFKLRRIVLSLRSAKRYCLRGYWNIDMFTILDGYFEFLRLLLKLIGFIPYVILDIIFSIIVAPFCKQVDRFEDITNINNQEEAKRRNQNETKEI